MNAASWLESFPAQERWRALLLKEGPRLATWALALGLGVQSAFIVTDLAGAGRRGATAPATRTAAASHALDPGVIASAHLFGAAPVTAQSGRGAPPTSIPLVLTGTIAGNDPQNGLAILGQTAQTAKVYAVGDNVPGGAKLHSVYSDRVVIDRDGQLESLALPRQLNAGNAPPPSSAVLQGETNSIERMRRMISEQPGLLADVMRPQPVMDHGRMNGFGLRPGDQVTAINGTPLDDRDRAEQILHTLSSSSEAHVTVIRNGQQQDLVLNIAQVAQEADSLAAQDSTGAAPAASPSGSAGAPFAPAPGVPAGERASASPPGSELAGEGRGQ
jgi:general secretion pathway protein C